MIGLSAGAHQCTCTPLRMSSPCYLQALTYYSRLAEHPRQSTPEVWSKVAGCHQALGSYDAAVGTFLKILGGLFQPVPVHACEDMLSHQS